MLTLTGSTGGLKVALRKESVDRNASALLVYLALIRSLSARRAWIEMSIFRPVLVYLIVALRKESVDRNCFCSFGIFGVDTSLSARRAWIEMLASRLVDMSAACRSPQGERG